MSLFSCFSSCTFFRKNPKKTVSRLPSDLKKLSNRVFERQVLANQLLQTMEANLQKLLALKAEGFESGALDEDIASAKYLRQLAYQTVLNKSLKTTDQFEPWQEVLNPARLA
ncbi:MAG: hypothetical protein K0U12_04515 [Gammaproteobacteria bacterium]|nr:hypothetical protein [Gammaproteobacteria bacterium]